MSPEPHVSNLTRGFTGQEHVDSMGLIHMNGRVYDPEVGRFVSADPIIQAPEKTQSYNRYTYVFNNPLSYTDPSGFTTKHEETGRSKRGNRSNGNPCVQDSSCSFAYLSSSNYDALVGPAPSPIDVAYGSFGSPVLPEGLSSQSLFEATVEGWGISSSYSKAGRLLSRRYTPQIRRYRNAHKGNSAAGVLAAGWVGAGAGAGAEHTPIGEALMAVATGGALLYYGPEILDKMDVELSGILAKATGPNSVQYSLRATHDGIYPCYRCASGSTRLTTGEVWKYGETTNPSSRYSSAFLSTNSLQQVNEFYGNQLQIKVVEKMKIYNHALINQRLPPGNRIFR